MSREESEMVEKVIDGKLHTKETIIPQFIKLVHWECNKHKNFAASIGQDYDDILSEGFIGLLKAFDRFDYERFQTRFSSYAGPYISGEINKMLRGVNTGTHFPHGIKTLAWQIRRAEVDDLSPEAIATQLDVKIQHVNQALLFLHTRRPKQLDQPVQAVDDDTLTLGDVLGNRDDKSDIFVQEFLESLSDKEKAIVRGLENNQTQTEISAVVGISQVSVSRTIAKIRDKYRGYERGEMVV